MQLSWEVDCGCSVLIHADLDEWIGIAIGAGVNVSLHVYTWTSRAVNDKAALSVQVKDAVNSTPVD